MTVTYAELEKNRRLFTPVIDFMASKYGLDPALRHRHSARSPLLVILIPVLSSFF